MDIRENAYRNLPPVHAVVDDAALDAARAISGRESIVAAVRAVIDDARASIAAGESPAVDAPSLATQARERLQSAGRMTLRPVINATGILLHTGLGRAPLADAAIDAIARVASGYCNLEFDLETGRRGGRTDAVERLLRDLTGAEGAAIVNNNAAATVLALRALARGREVIVSRGQLVESAAASASRKSSPPRARSCARSARRTRPGSPTTSRPSIPRPPQSCESIPAITGSSASPNPPPWRASPSLRDPAACP